MDGVGQRVPSPADGTDPELQALLVLRRRDIRGLETLVALHQSDAFRLAQGIVGDRSTAEDVVADAFVRVYDAIHTFDLSRPFLPWFRRVVVNTALKATQRRHRFGVADPAAFVGPGHPQITHQMEQRDGIRRGLRTLPPSLRAAVVLRYLLDLPEKEVAATLGCPLGTVKWRLSEARSRLKRALLDQDFAPRGGRRR